MTHVPFNRAYFTGYETRYVEEAVRNAHLATDGEFNQRCRTWLKERVGVADALLVHSCTGALEMSAMLLDLQPGDEVIMPSFTFVTTANAFVLRGAVPVFVDVRPDTLNLDETLVEAAITERTRAIVPVHYAGVGCEMDALSALAARYGLKIVEDAAQGLGATYRGRPLGGIGSLGTLSFHETKNVTCGEGGALLISDPELVERAEILREKGTNRSRFFRGQVDKYTWVDIGSSYGLSEVAAAFLWAQLEHVEEINARRARVWEAYHEGLAGLEAEGRLRRPLIPDDCEHPAHMYYVLVPTPDDRPRLLAELARRGINAVFHYVPLHSSPAGRGFARSGSTMAVTDDASERLVRLPLWAGMDDALTARVVAEVVEAVESVVPPALSRV